MTAYSYLFSQLVSRELRRKYKGSSLGVLWYLVNPLVLMAAYWLMFGHVFKLQSIPAYPIFLMVGLIVWTFFQQSLLSSAESLIDQGSLVRKARFPRESIPASTVTVQLITFLAILVLLTPLALIIRSSFGAPLLLLPFLVAALFAFVLGCALIVAVLHAYFRDTAPILTAALLPWFFLTPIFFNPQTIPFVERNPFVGTLLEWLNPIAPFIEAIRSVLYSGQAPDLGRIAYVVIAAIVALLTGSAIFRRMQGELAVVV